MQIIDNQKLKMADVINSIMPSSQNLYFRTGYFYFSGFKEIFKNLLDKNLKILVGKDCQIGLGGLIQEIIYPDLSNRSRTSIRLEYYKSLVNVFRNSSDIDNQNTEEAYEIFKKKILDGTLEIKKTVTPDHSKVYVFEYSQENNQNGLNVGAVIKGSSNLTYSGLIGQEEENELHKDNDYFELYKNKFNTLWKDAIPLVDKETFLEFENNVIPNTWLDKTPSPYNVYLRVIDEYFSIKEDSSILTPAKITGDKIDLKYQVEAVQGALQIIEKHNGVIVADVVGLGKSIIASCIARNLNLDTIVIAPPHLIQQWEDYRYEFKFNARVYGTGSVEKALNENNNDNKKLIIVDEAHKFRNEEKSLYANLHKLTKGNKVVLLTATPFNNNPKDIFSLIKLFQTPGKSTLQTIDNLSLRFRDLIATYNHIKKMKKDKESEVEIKIEINRLTQEMRDLLGPLLIRRSRLDLKNRRDFKQDLEIQGIDFPKINKPIALKYEFGELQSKYLKTLNTLVPEDKDLGFKGARYNVINNIENQVKKEEIAKILNTDVNLLLRTQVNLAEFMKKLLVHRFESSIDAFKKTLDKMIISYEQIEKWFYKGEIPIYKKGDLPDVDDFYDSEGDEALDKIDELFEHYEEKGMILIETKYLKNTFISDLKSDLKVLNEIKLMWQDFEAKKDPKVLKIKTEINKCLLENPDRKIVIFSIYSDTVSYLFNQLKDDYKIFKYSSIDSSQANKKLIKENFDAGSLIQKDEYDILLATDAISEGYNLHRAGIIFNYDIPYNPTRVIQRVGRINRINKKVFDTLYIYNFFPSPTGEDEIGIRRISTLKIDVIKALLGDDTQYLSEDEIIKTYDQKIEEEFDNSEELSWDTKYKDLLFSLQKSSDIDEARQIPIRVKIKRSVEKAQKGVLVFGKKNDDYAFKLCAKNDDKPLSLTGMEAVRLFEAEKTEKSEKVTSDFYALYELAKKNLFIKKFEVPKDKGLKEALKKIEWIKENHTEYRDYMIELKYVMKDLADLPARYAKTIRSISKDNLDEGIKKLMSEVPISYLIKIRDEAEKVGEGPESLILAEEF